MNPVLPGRPIRALVVDDSAFVRRTVTELIARDPDFEVVGCARDGREALEMTGRLRPDVVSLDINMPVMDGLTCLGRLVSDFKQPVVILSTLARKSSFSTFKALAIGAVDFVTKPGAGTYLSTLEELGEELRAKLRAAAAVPIRKIGRRRSIETRSIAGDAAVSSDTAPDGCNRVVPIGSRLRAVVGVGGSTGGTVALECLLRNLPAFLPVSLVVVQHIPAGFTSYFARYLDGISAFSVHEAEEGIPVLPHCAYLAASGAHLRIQRKGCRLVLRTDSLSPPNSGYRPSINTLFYSVAAAERWRSIGILLSGMGEDGVNGMKAVRRMGGMTLVQDDESSVVFDMGARAMSADVVDEILPPEDLAAAILRSLRQRGVVSGNLSAGGLGHGDGIQQRS